MTARPTFNILISGVGGQGVVLASYVLSQTALAEGYDVKQSEVHGMAQRGGCVTGHLRFGERVLLARSSPRAPSTSSSRSSRWRPPATCTGCVPAASSCTTPCG